MAYGLDVDCPHIFDGTHFARWKDWHVCNFKFICPQMWWIVDVGFSHVLDENDLTQAQEKCLHLEDQASNLLYRSLDDSIFGEIIKMKTAHEIWSYLNDKYGAASDDDENDDDPKVVAHEDVEHDHNLVVVEDCSTSCSSDQDERSTTRSLDKDDDDTTSDANDDATPCTLDGDDDSTCSTTSPDCFMSHGDTKVSFGDIVVDCDGPNFELVCRLIKMLNKEFAKNEKLKNENSLLKTTCEQQEHLLYVTTCSHEVLKLAHEELSVAHDNLSNDHAFLTNKLSKKENQN